MDGHALLGADGRPVVRPPDRIYHESAEWLDARTTLGDDGLVYPSIDRLLASEPGGVLSIREELRDLVERAKHRAVYDGDWFLLYRPALPRGRFDLTPRSAAARAVTDPGVKARIAEDLSATLVERMLRLPGARLDPQTQLLDFLFEHP
jgi:hypothetical protein